MALAPRSLMMLFLAWRRGGVTLPPASAQSFILEAEIARLCFSHHPLGPGAGVQAGSPNVWGAAEAVG